MNQKAFESVKQLKISIFIGVKVRLEYISLVTYPFINLVLTLLLFSFKLLYAVKILRIQIEFNGGTFIGIRLNDLVVLLFSFLISDLFASDCLSAVLLMLFVKDVSDGCRTRLVLVVVRMARCGDFAQNKLGFDYKVG